ncbi:MAG: BphX family protein [Devosia sp.]
MTRTKWWLRAVGALYLLLTVMNLWVLFFTNGEMLAGTLPGDLGQDPLAIRAFADAWLVFVLELGVLGAMALFASLSPERGRILILTIIWAEVFRGIVADVIWITRGYSPASYGVFIAIHLVIIASGWLVLRDPRR